MSQENKSLTAIALQKFKQNFWGVFSFGYIVLMVFLALFAYVFSPDDTENANQMHLSIHSQSPGFEVKMISVPNEFLSPKTFKSYFFGSTNQITEIPIKAYVIKNDVLHYIEYNDDESIQIEKEITLDKFYGYSSFKEVEKELITDKKFYLGTDKYGRDLLSRMLVGSRVSISIGFVAVLISVLVGLFFGSLGGFYGGKVDAAVMWLVNVIWSIPTLLLVIAITLALGKGFWQVFVAVGLTMWVEVARVVRGQIISVKEMQYVTAARALGFSNIRIIINHILPNIMAPVIVISAANFASAILVESGLSFLGLGAQPPIPSWGGMIKDHYSYIILGKPYLALIPGMAIMFITLAFMMTGNALRDAMDVK
ncbi:ABC transporter permease [Flavobacterium sp. UBA6135]|uniref:ABC transporter permease n=1 Tax=Flavobacterium sp. UBA6135 TaxID=1946553 RepID=UPI0025BE3DFB|nr:ABC transporter permease [Flavobacterium sp. UBA6135]